MTLTMSDYNKIEQQVKDLKDFLNHRFNENDKAHSEIIKRQDYSNGKIRCNTDWRLKNEEAIRQVLVERHDTRKQIKTILIQAVVAGMIAGLLVMAGANNL